MNRHSQTSDVLYQILLILFWKRDVVNILTKGNADAFVLIGDRTFGQKEHYSYCYDLGHFWKELTGLPFAYAVWASNTVLPEDFVVRFNRALADGLSRIQEVIPGLPPFDNFDYQTYLTVNLDYALTSEKRQAIDQYLTWYREL